MRPLQSQGRVDLAVDLLMDLAVDLAADLAVDLLMDLHAGFWHVNVMWI